MNNSVPDVQLIPWIKLEKHEKLGCKEAKMHKTGPKKSN